MKAQNLAAAALFSQFIFLVILVVTSAIMARLQLPWVPFYRRDPRQSSYTVLLLLLTLSSFGAFFISDVFVELWQPLFGNADFPQISSSAAISTMLVLNLVSVFILVMNSGGARRSPFSAGIFLVPTLALFLREPVVWIVVYASLSAVCLTVLNRWLAMESYSEPDGGFRDRAAFWFMNLSCLILATWIGVLTRPIA